MLIKFRQLSHLQITLIILVVTLITYLPALFNNFVYDDYIVILDETADLTFSGIKQIFTTSHYPFLPYYRPVVRLTFLVQSTLFGVESALPFHFVNILLAGILGIVSFKFFTSHLKLTPPLSLITLLLFILHPITSSTVYPAASGRETLLPILFLITSLYFYLFRSTKEYRLSLVFFALALFSKEQAIIFPLLLLLADILKVNLKKRPEVKTLIQRQFLFWFVTGLYVVVRNNIFTENRITLNSDLSLILATPLYAVQQFLFPFITLHYEPMSIRSWFSLPKILGALVLIVILFIIAQKHKVSKNYLLFFIGFALISLLPNANVLNQDAHFEERYLLLSLFGAVSLLGYLLQKSTLNVKLLLIPLGIFSAISFHRAQYFKDNLTFSTQWVKTSPEYYLPYFNLGRSYEERKEYDLALAYYQKSSELNPSFSANYLNQGTVLLQQGEMDDALTQFIVYQHLEPASASGFYHAGLVYLYTEQPDLAAQQFIKAIELDERMVEAYNNLGAAYEVMGNVTQARTHYQKALQLDLTFTSAQNNLNRLNGSSSNF